MEDIYLWSNTTIGEEFRGATGSGDGKESSRNSISYKNIHLFNTFFDKCRGARAEWTYLCGRGGTW